jgi:hypothetical protein
VTKSECNKSKPPALAQLKGVEESMNDLRRNKKYKQSEHNDYEEKQPTKCEASHPHKPEAQ